MESHKLPYALSPAGSEPIDKQQTVKKTIDSGTSYGYFVEFDDYEEQLLLNYVDWDSSGAEVRADVIDGNNNLLKRLEHGLRMGVSPLATDRSKSEVQVRMAKIKDGEWSNKFKCTLRELSEPFAETFNAAAFLSQRCIAIGEAAALAEHIGKKRSSDIYAVIASDDKETAVHIYVISRVLPILKKVLADRQMRMF